MTGDPIFSDTRESPWQLGSCRSTSRRAARSASCWPPRAKTTRSRSCAQNDDYGNGYVEGFTEAIEGADNIEIVKALTYEATDTSVDAQLTELAASGADVFFNAMSITPLVISSLQEDRSSSAGRPAGSCPRTRRARRHPAEPDVHAAAFPGIYTVAFSQSRRQPHVRRERRGPAFLDALEEYGEPGGRARLPALRVELDRCRDSRAGLREDGPSRPGRASWRRCCSIEDYSAPFMLEGSTINTTEDGKPAVSAVQVQKYNGKGYAPAETYGG